jgi:hypothetical protein
MYCFVETFEILQCVSAVKLLVPQKCDTYIKCTIKQTIMKYVDNTTNAPKDSNIMTCHRNHNEGMGHDDANYYGKIMDET